MEKYRCDGPECTKDIPDRLKELKDRWINAFGGPGPKHFCTNECKEAYLAAKHSKPKKEAKHDRKV